jgi:hypothetical protein
MQTVNSDAATPPIEEIAPIVDITNATILNYFEAFNAGDYEATSQQFASDGTLHPPFESPIVGRDKIEHYLKAEAKGITAQPQQETIGQTLEDGCTEIQVTGRVQTPWIRTLLHVKYPRLNKGLKPLVLTSIIASVVHPHPSPLSCRERKPEVSCSIFPSRYKA